MPSHAQLHGTIRGYLLGYILSILLSGEAFILVMRHAYMSRTLIIVILLLAIVQLFVQLHYFLHLDRAFKAPWNLIIFGFMAVIVSILVFGSLWIMSNLDYNMMVHEPDGTTIQINKTPEQLDQYIKQDENIQTHNH